jgi:hypothetical protein
MSGLDIMYWISGTAIFFGVAMFLLWLYDKYNDKNENDTTVL